jgi:hypothetical protein
MGRVLAFGTVIVGALVVADLWAHYRVTSQVIKAGVSESRLIAGK